MKNNTKNWITNQVTKILDKTMKTEFPNLNTYKIAKFYTNALAWTLTLTSTIILIITFTWYFPTFYQLKPETAIIILLCLIFIKINQNE